LIDDRIDFDLTVGLTEIFCNCIDDLVFLQGEEICVERADKPVCHNTAYFIY